MNNCYMCGKYADTNLETSDERVICLECFSRVHGTDACPELAQDEPEETEEILKCIECEEPIDGGEERGEYLFTDDGPLCYDCESSAMERASTLVHYGLGVGDDGTNKHTAKITDHFIRDTEYYEEVSWPLQVIGPRKYVQTDAWRGYYDSPILGGYMSLADGWATGRYSDVPWKHRVQDLGELLENGAIPPGAGLWVLLEPTSNIFSMATTFICKVEDEDTIKAWLVSIGLGVEELKEALR